MLSGLLLCLPKPVFRNSLSDHSCPAVNPLENVIDPAEQKEAAGIRRMRQTFSGIFFAAGNKHQKAELNEGLEWDQAAADYESRSAENNRFGF